MSVKAIETDGKTYREIELYRPNEFETGVAYGQRNFQIDEEVIPLYEKNPPRVTRRCTSSKDLLVKIEDL
jgi:hypothetical protein